MLTSAMQVTGSRNGKHVSVESDDSADTTHLEAAVASQIARALESALAPDPAALYREQLAQERDRLSLLLEITNRISSNLDLHELLRGTSAALRQVMQCDGGVVVVLPDEESGQPWVHALDFPESDRFVSEELLASRGG